MTPPHRKPKTRARPRSLPRRGSISTELSRGGAWMPNTPPRPPVGPPAGPPPSPPDK